MSIISTFKAAVYGPPSKPPKRKKKGRKASEHYTVIGYTKSGKPIKKYHK